MNDQLKSPLNKLTSLPAFLQLLLQIALAILGDVTTGEDIGDGYA
jgi:hypothetical protein